MTPIPFTVVPLPTERVAEAAALEQMTIPGGMSESAFTETCASPSNRAVAALDAAGRLIGFGILSLVADEAEILSIATSPDVRRCGVGRALLLTLLADADMRGAAHVYLEVRASNIPAQNLYRRVGFTECGRRKNYYSHPREDAVLMTCPTDGEREPYANSRN